MEKTLCNICKNRFFARLKMKDGKTDEEGTINTCIYLEEDDLDEEVIVTECTLFKNKYKKKYAKELIDLIKDTSWEPSENTKKAAIDFARELSNFSSINHAKKK